MNSQPKSVLTIGHSNHSAATFLSLLRNGNIDAVADVRSSPYSRFNPQFNREELEKRLKDSGIHYVFLGKELGARTDDQSCYLNGQVQYDRLAHTATFQSGLDRVQSGALRYRIALMCSEREPLECHRTLLVARSLVERGIPVEHIHADGGIESHEAAMLRLLDLVDLPRVDLFRTREELLADAITRQAQRVAYVDKAQSQMIVDEDSL